MMAFMLYSLLLSIATDHPEPPFDLCDTPTLAGNSPYRSSLDNLLSSISSTLSPGSKFFQTSNGTAGSDKVYGLFLCYDYSTQLDCRQCAEATSLPAAVKKLCPYKYEATVWVDYCLFRYSTRNFSGDLNVTGNVPLDNAKNVTEPQRFRSIVNRTLHDIAVVAAFDPSSGMHANGSEFFTEDYNLYAFVQCSKDLSPGACSACLTAAMDDILVDRFYYTRGARVLSRSCFLRYELYNFVEGETEENLNLAPSSAKKNRKWIIVVAASGAGVLLLLALGCFVFRLVRRRQAGSVVAPDEVEMNGEDLDVVDTSFGLQHGLDPQELPFIEMEIIAEATDNFSELNKLGEGGFGPVFKGRLRDGQFIAVKRLSINSEQGSEEFINEVLLIHKLQHVNLVKLLGFSVHQDEKLLVYDYMPNGSLDSFLFDSRKRAQLNWRRRVDIINGVARGMLYLHQDSRLTIIHRDLKPSNILLDANMKPKISDFGMAKIFGGGDGEANTAKIVGTYGYMAPEFAMEGVYSIKSDVFSFGVLLLEMITGRRNARFHITRLGPSLLAYAWKSWNEGKARELMDPVLVVDPFDNEEKEEEEEDEFVRCMQIGLLCVQEDARDRPSMASVVQMLNRESAALSQPERPSFTVGNLLDHHSHTYLDNLSQNNLTISDLLPR